MALWIARAASSGASPRAASNGGVSRANNCSVATRSSICGAWIGAWLASLGECPPYATNAAIRLASTESTLRSVCVLIVMPSTRFSASCAGHSAAPCFTLSSDLSNVAFTSCPSVSSSPTWNSRAKTRVWIPARCRSLASACNSPRASGSGVSLTFSATSPPRSTRISSPFSCAATLRRVSYAPSRLCNVCGWCRSYRRAERSNRCRQRSARSTSATLASGVNSRRRRGPPAGEPSELPGPESACCFCLSIGNVARRTKSILTCALVLERPGQSPGH